MPTLPIDTHGLRWFDDSPEAGDRACTCSHCDQIIADEVPLRLWNATGQEARLHQRCFALRTGAPPEADFAPVDMVDEVPDELIVVGPCCACRRTDVEPRNLVLLPVRGPEPGKGWGCVICGLPSDGALAVVCDACLEQDRPIVDAVEGYVTTGGNRIPRDTLTVPFDHKAVPH